MQFEPPRESQRLVGVSQAAGCQHPAINSRSISRRVVRSKAVIGMSDDLGIPKRPGNSMSIEMEACLSLDLGGCSRHSQRDAEALVRLRIGVGRDADSLPVPVGQRIDISVGRKPTHKVLVDRLCAYKVGYAHSAVPHRLGFAVASTRWNA